MKHWRALWWNSHSRERNVMNLTELFLEFWIKMPHLLDALGLFLVMMLITGNYFPESAFGYCHISGWVGHSGHREGWVNIVSDCQLVKKGEWNTLQVLSRILGCESQGKTLSSWMHLCSIRVRNVRFMDSKYRTETVTSGLVSSSVPPYTAEWACM